MAKASATPPPGWYTIEDAPRNGRRIVLLFGDGRVASAKFVRREVSENEVIVRKYNGWVYDMGGLMTMTGDPLWWMDHPFKDT